MRTRQNGRSVNAHLGDRLSQVEKVLQEVCVQDSPVRFCLSMGSDGKPRIGISVPVDMDKSQVQSDVVKPFRKLRHAISRILSRQCPGCSRRMPKPSAFTLERNERVANQFLRLRQKKMKSQDAWADIAAQELISVDRVRDVVDRVIRGRILQRDEELRQEGKSLDQRVMMLNQEFFRSESRIRKLIMTTDDAKNGGNRFS